METRTYRLGAELDPLIYAHRDEDGDLIDFTAGWTFTLGCAPVGGAALATGGFPKTTGITGGLGLVTVAWTATDLGVLPAGTFDLKLRITLGSKDHTIDERITVKPAHS